MDHRRTPVLDALVDYHRRDRYGFSPPGHRQGRGADPRARRGSGHRGSAAGCVAGLASAADSFDRPPPVRLPSPDELQLQSVLLPRDAFFGSTEMVSAATAAGRIAAEQITPYPPGIPAVVPGERLNDAVIEYLRSGVSAGMTLPDSADPQLRQIRVTA